MYDVIETLMDACGALGIRPSEPFTTVHDFEAMILDRHPAAGESEKASQLEWVLKAVREAEAHHVGGVVACIEQIKALS